MQAREELKKKLFSIDGVKKKVVACLLGEAADEGFGFSLKGKQREEFFIRNLGVKAMREAKPISFAEMMKKNFI
jgi:hypothetical protein